MKFMLVKNIEVRLADQAQIVQSIFETNEKGNAYWSPIADTIYADCEKKPKDHPGLGIFWEEVEDVRDEG